MKHLNCLALVAAVCTGFLVRNGGAQEQDPQNKRKTCAAGNFACHEFEYANYGTYCSYFAGYYVNAPEECDQGPQDYVSIDDECGIPCPQDCHDCENNHCQGPLGFSPSASAAKARVQSFGGPLTEKKAPHDSFLVPADATEAVKLLDSCYIKFKVKNSADSSAAEQTVYAKVFTIKVHPKKHRTHAVDAEPRIFRTGFEISRVNSHDHDVPAENVAARNSHLFDVETPCGVFQITTTRKW